MAIQRIQCQTHNGFFERESRPGRVPIRCNEENPCDAVRAVGKATRKRRTTTATVEAPVKAAPAPVQRARKATPKPEPRFKPEKDTREAKGLQASKEKALAAKAELESKGWTVSGRKDGNRVEVTATRDDELFFAVWENGILAQPMHYSLWSLERQSENAPGMPARQVPYDPEWVTDRELAQMLVGNKIHVWNRVGKMLETMVCGTEKISIEHIYDGTGDEFPDNRILKFTDGPLGVTRVVRLGQIVKVGGNKPKDDE